MAVLFLDSSAVVKQYIFEQGSNRVRAAVDPTAGNELFISAVTGAEVVAGIVRRRRLGDIDRNAANLAIQEFIDDWQTLYNHLAIEGSLIERAMALAQMHELRGYDAVQLASAFLLNDRYRSLSLPITVVSADKELNAAAIAEGLLVDDPNS